MTVPGRVAVWSVPALLVLLPALLSGVVPGMDWGAEDYLAALALGVAFVLAAEAVLRRARRTIRRVAGVAACVLVLAVVWGVLATA
ncbi:hypothetical protein GI374_07745 [Paracoccus sp. S-4012]|uniref:hypothetical protein n=1 Tax=Paracoccus sp. S-4012 TaxID=2665648 RepID=UPI0012B02FBE|nr:hypothetical protein [Paracoccus sp. S-4012]MRX50343.1 hypothetical protein [Paracoccus sp. S-4012]